MLLDPNWEYKPHERGGGRTTKLMLDAIQLLYTWQHVVYLTLNWNQADWCAMHLDIIRGYNDIPIMRMHKHVFFYEGACLWFTPISSDPFQYLTNQPVPSVLVDHYTNEEAGHSRELIRWLDIAYHRHNAMTRRY